MGVRPCISIPLPHLLCHPRAAKPIGVVQFGGPPSSTDTTAVTSGVTSPLADHSP